MHMFFRFGQLQFPGNDGDDQCGTAGALQIMLALAQTSQSHHYAGQ